MRLAIVGGGVSGLVAASLLHPRYDITVFEAGDRVGGHTHTVPVDLDGRRWDVDTGFIVYNERNYPNFTQLLARLGVPTQPSTMSFSVRSERLDLEYNGSSLGQLYGQRRNLFRPSFHRMVLDIVRFNRTAPRAIRDGAATATIAEYVAAARYSAPFVDQYLVPMASAIWSQPRTRVLEMPLAFVVRFFEHHGMLTVDDRPQWRVVAGGSQRYVAALTEPFRDRLRVRHPVRAVTRSPDHVTVDGERFDGVVLACHSDQALALLQDPSDAERAILGALPYQANDVVLHTDTSLLPRRQSLWAAWNYHLETDAAAPVAITYDMNILQTLAAPVTFCVSLNRTAGIAPERVIKRLVYHHPIYSSAGVRAQSRWSEISGQRRTHYCGAYWGYGFHEDGVTSALAVARTLGGAS